VAMWVPGVFITNQRYRHSYTERRWEQSESCLRRVNSASSGWGNANAGRSTSTNWGRRHRKR